MTHAEGAALALRGAASGGRWADGGRARGAALFSRRRMMDAWVSSGTADAAMIAPDGLHHNDRGYACLAEALADRYGIAGALDYSHRRDPLYRIR